MRRKLVRAVEINQGYPQSRGYGTPLFMDVTRFELNAGLVAQKPLVCLHGTFVIGSDG